MLPASKILEKAYLRARHAYLTVAEELLDRGGHQHDLAAARDRQQEPVQHPEQRVLHFRLLDHHRFGLRFGAGLAKHCE